MAAAPAIAPLAQWVVVAVAVAAAATVAVAVVAAAAMMAAVVMVMAAEAAVAAVATMCQVGGLPHSLSWPLERRWLQPRLVVLEAAVAPASSSPGAWWQSDPLGRHLLLPAHWLW